MWLTETLSAPPSIHREYWNRIDELEQDGDAMDALKCKDGWLDMAKISAGGRGGSALALSLGYTVAWVRCSGAPRVTGHDRS